MISIEDILLHSGLKKKQTNQTKPKSIICTNKLGLFKLDWPAKKRNSRALKYSIERMSKWEDQFIERERFIYFEIDWESCKILLNFFVIDHNKFFISVRGLFELGFLRWILCSFAIFFILSYFLGLRKGCDLVDVERSLLA